MPVGEWHTYGSTMAPRRSPEIEAVARRVLAAYIGEFGTMRNLMSADPSLRVLGSDVGEWWHGVDDFIAVRSTQSEESPDLDIRIGEVEGFEDGEFGWAVLFSTVVMPEAEQDLRHSVLFRLEDGVWRVLQWHNSAAVPNLQIFGVELTVTLDDLLSSVLDDIAALPPSDAVEGTMTLVFTDIVDSTPITESVGDDVWAGLIAEHESVIRETTSEHQGTVVKYLGDGSMLAFDSARAAVRAAVDIQRRNAGTPFGVRIGVHSGDVMRTSSDMFGLTVNKAARVAAAAGHGQIMVSATTRDLVGRIDGLGWGDPLTIALKGVSGTHQVVPVLWSEG